MSKVAARLAASVERETRSPPRRTPRHAPTFRDRGGSSTERDGCRRLKQGFAATTVKGRWRVHTPVSGTRRYRTTSTVCEANLGNVYSRPDGDYRRLLRHVNSIDGADSSKSGRMTGHAGDNRRPCLRALLLLAPRAAHRVRRSLRQSRDSDGANRWPRSLFRHAPRGTLQPPGSGPAHRSTRRRFGITARHTTRLVVSVLAK